MNKLEESMNELKSIFFNLSATIEESFRKSTEIMLNKKVSKINDIVELDKEIDRKEIHIEESCIHILAMHQPKAKDLRFIIAVLKINNDLERIGDLSMNIARSAKRLNEFQLNKEYSIPLMVKKVLTMFKYALDSFMTLDAELAVKVCKLDDEVDDLKREQRKLLKEDLFTDPEYADYFFELLVNARRLERVADLCTNIAEEVIYISKGEIVRHRSFDESTI